MKITTIEELNGLPDASRVTLHPNSANPLHDKPVGAYFSGGYFYADDNDETDWPDYYWRDVFKYNSHIELTED